MTTLHQYLQEKYPTQEDKEAVIKIDTSEITEPLEGGELDLRDFKNLKEVIIATNLTTPLTKIEINGLTSLEQLILPDKPQEESEEEKKLYEELGISEDTHQKKLVQEVKRLAELKSVQVHFGDKNEETTETNQTIYLSLDKKDKAGNFCPSLVFWSLSQELVLISIGGDETSKTPDFWKKLEEELIWVKENLTKEYQKEFELLLTPSIFPTELLEISELYQVYFPTSEIANSQALQVPISPELVDETWKTIKQELLELIAEELKTNADKEILAIKLLINNQSIQVNYQAENPLRAKIEQLLTTTPLKLEIETLKKKQEQLPTPENYEKLAKEKQELEEYLKENTDTDTYREIQEKMSKKNYDKK